MEDVRRHGLEDRFDGFVRGGRVAADHESAFARVGGVHVGLGDGGVDQS